MVSRTSHIQTRPGLPVSTKALPKGSSGSRIYCDRKTSVAGVASPSLTIDLTARSTLNIQAVWTFNGSVYSCGFNVDGIDYGVPATGLVTMETTAITRDRGSCTITASSAPTTGSPPSGTVMLVVIVGANTGDDCLENCIPTSIGDLFLGDLWEGADFPDGVRIPLPAGNTGDLLFAFGLTELDIAGAVSGWTAFGNEHNTAFGTTPVARRWFKVRAADDTHFTLTGYAETEGMIEVFNIPSGSAADIYDFSKDVSYSATTSATKNIGPGSGQGIIVMIVWTTGDIADCAEAQQLGAGSSSPGGDGFGFTTFYSRTLVDTDYTFTVPTGEILGVYWHGFTTCGPSNP